MLKYAPKTCWLRYNNKLYRDVPVHSYKLHPTGSKERASWMVKDCVALELITQLGSSWVGVDSGFINSELKMVVEIPDRDGVPRDELKWKWEDYKEGSLV